MVLLNRNPLKTLPRLLGKILVVASSLALGSALYYSTFDVANIKGISMMPTISNGDRAVLQKRFFAPEIGKVYSLNEFDSEYSNGQALHRLIKRVIAGPGDTLTFYASTGEWLSVNGKQLDLRPNKTLPELSLTSHAKGSEGESVSLIPYFNHDLGTPVYKVAVEEFDGSVGKQNFRRSLLHYPYLAKLAAQGDQVSITVPEDHYFVMSDNWSGNVDSRYFGPIHKSIISKGMIKSFPKEASHD